MSYILCMAEKPSVAKDIATVIGATVKKNGYYEGNGYRVTWAIGHLVGLAEPNNYGYLSQKEIWECQENRQIALKELPLFPDKFKLVVLEPTKKQFAIVKQLMNDSNCKSIIDCGDAGAEGHILQYFIRIKAGCKKPVKRFIATSMTKEAILYAMNHLQDIDLYTSVILAEFCKKKADWVLGMSLSRAASIIYNAKVDVGRVQSPTLYYVVKRYLDHVRFIPQSYYTIQAALQGGVNLFWKQDKMHILNDKEKDSKNRIIDKNAALRLMKSLSENREGIITLLETKERAMQPPQLYDITELERDGNRLYGYTAVQVLQTAQILYETHKITTYPRTDSRYITHDLIPHYQERICDIANHEHFKYVCNAIRGQELKFDKRIQDDSKVTDHHAIIITDIFRTYDLSKLTEPEYNILRLIIIRMIETVSSKQKYQETKMQVTFPNNIVFEAQEKSITDYGWTAVKAFFKDFKTNSTKEKKALKNVFLGQSVSLKEVKVVPGQTTPPPLHTEATLLTMLENAGKEINNGDLLKGKGIGTQATRAAIINSLFEKKYIENQGSGKVKSLIPTKQGLSVIKVLPADLYSPQITANWEMKISQIVEGALSTEKFLQDFEGFINEKLRQILYNKVPDVDFSYDKVYMGKCPWCGQDVFLGKSVDKDKGKVEFAYCSNKSCKFYIRKDNIIFKMRTGRNLTTSQMMNLINGCVIEAKCVSKQQREYKGYFKIAKNAKGFTDVIFIMSKR